MAGRSVVYCLPNENRRFSQREAEALELNLTQKQVQTLSPQMMQSMEILQMGSQELPVSYTHLRAHETSKESRVAASAG